MRTENDCEKYMSEALGWFFVGVAISSIGGSMYGGINGMLLAVLTWSAVVSVLVLIIIASRLKKYMPWKSRGAK